MTNMVVTLVVIVLVILIGKVFRPNPTYPLAGLGNEKENGNTVLLDII